MRNISDSDGLHSLIRSFFADDKIAYLVTPVTSGIRLLHLAKNLGVEPSEVRNVARDLYECKVMKPNYEDAAAIASVIRQNGRPLLNPAELLIPSWQQEDYIAFFFEVMQRHVGCIYLGSGWEFSRGCLGEVVFGIKLKKPIYDSLGDEIDYDTIYTQIDLARSKALDAGLDVGYFPVQREPAAENK
jgi:hypothetical protein